MTFTCYLVSEPASHPSSPGGNDTHPTRVEDSKRAERKARGTHWSPGVRLLVPTDLPLRALLSENQLALTPTSAAVIIL